MFILFNIVLKLYNIDVYTFRDNNTLYSYSTILALDGINYNQESMQSLIPAYPIPDRSLFTLYST